MNGKDNKTATPKPFSHLPVGKRFLVSSAVSLAGLLVVIVYVLLCLHLLVPRGSWLNIVEGDSMYPTLKDGQLIYTEKKDIAYGDIVTAHFPEGAGDAKTVIVKRIIGLPGDHIQIDAAGIYVNGTLLNETYLTPDALANTYRQTPYNILTLGEDEYYLVGDNRFVSNDSRFFGPVKTEDILYIQSQKTGTNFWVRLILVLIILITAFFLHSWVDFRLTRLAQRLTTAKTNQENPEQELT